MKSHLGDCPRGDALGTVWGEVPGSWSERSCPGLYMIEVTDICLRRDALVSEGRTLVFFEKNCHDPFLRGDALVSV